MAKPTWLITGCSSGFGYSLARHVLLQGHNVIATSRSPSKTPDLVTSIEKSRDFSGSGRWLALDVTAPAATIMKIIQHAETLFGGIDILVNCARYSILGSFEDIMNDEDAARTEFETNFWGPAQLIKSVIPNMRARMSGIIVCISSVAALTALPTCSMYSASKWALEALSESLSAELQGFGIRILLVEPGAFRSNFLSSTASQYFHTSKNYEGSIVEATLKYMASMDGSSKET